MINYNWNYPTSMWVGKERVNDLGKACNQLNIQKPLVVTDKGLFKTNMILNILKKLKNENINVNIFSDIVGNPTGTNVNDGVKEFLKNKNDGVIALGGGSSLDVGKAIAFMSGQSLPLWEFEDIGDNWTKANDKKIAPIIAIPTTAGTGSETGRASVILNEKTGVKNIIFHPKFLPSVVILDPLLTLSLPPKITATTGMDALAHNLEAFCANAYHPMADGIALEGIRLINKWLLTAVRDGSNIDARMNMLVAASMGSTAFQKGLGAIHSLSHPVNAINNIHHGLSNAIFMPYVLTFNKEVIENKIIKVCEYIGLKDKSFDGFINWVLKLRKDLEIPHKLSEIIKQKDFDIERLSKMALKDPSTEGNPKKLTIEDMRLMYKHSMSGQLF
ncbi:MAG: iron-containing alcohol dehydrogenase [Candidatus Pelagibacter sp. TMED263]|jgi:alcohol dehydrogenase class IV|nr:MAG: iron-containing alcohol dehydrogenase [Candidatus Pelagibacter sp. TMED263]|tara:strand:- start:67 stop:1230 length:1164 start_codon:yes stop_codon:yes gene_type:complete